MKAYSILYYNDSDSSDYVHKLIEQLTQIPVESGFYASSAVEHASSHTASMYTAASIAYRQ